MKLNEASLFVGDKQIGTVWDVTISFADSCSTMAERISIRTQDVADGLRKLSGAASSAAEALRELGSTLESPERRQRRQARNKRKARRRGRR